jgi:ankyrin repeat protein
MTTTPLSLKWQAFAKLDEQQHFLGSKQHPAHNEPERNILDYAQMFGEKASDSDELIATYYQMKSFNKNELYTREYPLHWAAYNANSHAFKIFLKMGYQINTRTKDELHSTRGASITHRDTIPSIGGNRTPLRVARERLEFCERFAAKAPIGAERLKYIKDVKNLQSIIACLEQVGADQ